MDRSKGKPVAQIIEKIDFWKYEFKILKDVLIPRPDTEIIIGFTSMNRSTAFQTMSL